MFDKKLNRIFLLLLLTMMSLGCSESDDDDETDTGNDGITTLAIGQSVNGSLGDYNAEYRIDVESGAEYNVTLTPTTSADDPDLLIFSSEQQLNAYWDIVDANGGEDSTQAMNARIAKSDLSPGQVDQATFTAGHNDDYFAMVSGPDGTSFSIEVNSSSDGFGCGEECLSRVDANEQIISHSPAADSTVTDLSTQLSLELDSSVSSSFLQNMSVEIFQLPSDRDDCRIDWPGLRCGFLDAESSFDLVVGDSVITGTASVDGNTVNFSFAESFPAGYVFVVHVFADVNNDSFKTWWVFKT